MSNEQPSEWKSACPHPEAVGTRWGDSIGQERQAELKALAVRQLLWAARSEVERGVTPFRDVQLTGADVFWVVTYVLAGSNAEPASLLFVDRLLHAAITDAQVRSSVDASALHLEGANLSNAHLENAALNGAHLEAVCLNGAHLEKGSLTAAHLERAQFVGAHLEQAVFTVAYMERTLLNGAHLTTADLSNAQLEGAALHGAFLNEANLRGASFDKTSRMNGAVLTGASFDQITFDKTNLTVVDWSLVPELGDELAARKATHRGRKRKDVALRLTELVAAVRANRSLAVALRAQGLNEAADRFAYRAQVLQRQVLRRQGRLLSALGSWFLDVVAGYGYKPMRSFLAYVLVILGFAAAYFALGGANGKPLTWNEAIVVSMTAFHGRGFFSAVFQPGDIQAVVAALEAFIGLLIEIVFIATFTQRFFAR